MARILSEQQVARLAGERQSGMALFLGAGASVSSGVPGAGAMVKAWRVRAHQDEGDDTPVDDWLRAQPWYGRETEYSELFALVCPNQSSRQKYIESQLEGHSPSWGYLYLANLMAQGWFPTTLTTNFDHLLAEALSRYADTVPLVGASDMDVLAMSYQRTRPKILKLHGDYLFLSQRHTVAELEALGEPMRHRFAAVVDDHEGLLVLGYGGRDRSVMRPLHDALAAAGAMGPPVYWGLWREETPSAPVAELAKAFGERFHLFRYDDFDAFAARVHRQAGLSLPDPVLRPYVTLKARMSGLVGAPDSPIAAAAVQADREQLQTQLDRVELLDAHVALARRRFDQALPVAEAFVGRHPDNATGHLVLANACLQRAEDSGSDADARRGLEALGQAVRLDAQNIAALYGLASTHARLMHDNEAMAAMQQLLPLVPRDKALRANLAMLYARRGRSPEATALLRECLREHPNDAQLHGLWAQLLVQNGDNAAALAAIDRAIALDDGQAALHAFRAQALVGLYRPQAAVQAFQRALALDPDNTLTRLACARVLMAMGDLQAAHGEAAIAVKANPDSVEALGLMAQLMAMMGPPYWHEALRHFDALLARTPGDARAWSSRGLLLGSMNRLPEAEHDLNEAVRLTPDEVAHRMALARFYAMTGRPDRVQGVLSEIDRLSPLAAQQLRQELQMHAQMPPQMAHGQSGGMPGILGGPQGAPVWPGQGGAPSAGGGMLQRLFDALR